MENNLREKIDIRLKLHPEAEWIELSVEEGTTLEELLYRFDEQNHTDVLAAKTSRFERKVISLKEKIVQEEDYEFLDMSEPSANQIYQRSLIFMYLKAVHDILGEDRVIVANSLNKGIYTEIRGAKSVTAYEVKRLYEYMRGMSAANLPFEQKILPAAEALEHLESQGSLETKKMFEKLRWSQIPMYSLDVYESFFYDFLAPSTGYIRYFELKKYRRGILLRFPHPDQPNVIPEYRDDKKLYQAFGEATRWLKLMDMEYVSDLNERVRDGSYRQLIQVSEALHEKRIAEIADMIAKQKKRIILIAGPSSSGKTTFAQRLCTQLRVNGLKPIYLGTDDYFVDREFVSKDAKGEYNFEDLEAVDVALFNEHMNRLLAGEEVDVPIYNFISGKKEFGKRFLKISADQPIVIEGIHGLNEKLTEKIEAEAKFKIYISPLTQINIDEHNRIPTTDARLLRRIVRDSQFRNYPAQRTIKMWKKVREGEDKNIFPYNGEADVLFNSVHLYELAVLKKYAQPLLSDISAEEPEYTEATRLLKFLRLFEVIGDDRSIANNSILREFIGGSVFVD
ncbi:MAG: nucleoside kinase [Firmicutes bacterium]|nr:nucleoside kinase [Bacillota bacterium]